MSDDRRLQPESNPVDPAPDTGAQPLTGQSEESFADLLSAFEKTHSHKAEPGAAQLQGTVVSLSADQVFLDIGYKTEGVLPRSAFDNNAAAVKPGDIFPVSVTGRNEEHYYQLSRFKVAQPRDWSALEAAFEQKLAVVGTVTALVKGGLSVDVGVRAFMPASRSGTRDAGELEKLVDTEITCRITKLDIADENVVVDRRVVLEEQARALQQGQYEAMKEGDVVAGTVRTLMPYGAFVDLGGIDGLLHVSDISYARVTKPEDVLTVGQQLQVKILKIDLESKKISLGLKQLQPEPWEKAPERLLAGQRITGTVTRLADFGAFVEIEPGVEGLIHISEMSYGKKLRHPSDILKQGDRVDAVILSIKPEERRIALGLKQTLTDPWFNVPQKFPVGSQIEGPITKLMNFGAFVQLEEGIEGLIHVSEISAEKRIHHPQDVLRVGQVVKAQVLAIDPQKRQIKLSMKQLVPTSIDEYIAEHKVGDHVSGRVFEQSPSLTHVELGEGIRAVCCTNFATATPTSLPTAQLGVDPDLSSLSSMLKARWKGNSPSAASGPEPLSAGQIRTFKIKKLDPETKRIEIELA
jgi:small subunit ribosomal protein S1